MFDTREPKTGPSKAPKPKTPTPTTAPRPLKANQQRWERTFRGAAKGVTFQLRIIRRPDGHLSARYQATPGKGSGWHLEGQLRDDNTFTLKGTENKAEFQGKISPDGKTVISNFTNVTTKDTFTVSEMTLRMAVWVNTPASSDNSETQSNASTNQVNTSTMQWTAVKSGSTQFDNNPAVRSGILWAAGELGINPNDLATCISFESNYTFSPAEPNGAGGKAIGLIQFLPPSFAQMNQYLNSATGSSDRAKRIKSEIEKYGWSANKLNRSSFKSMNFDEQIKYVVLHFKAHGLKPNSPLSELYRKILAPFSDTEKMYTKGDGFYEANSGLDINDDDIISAAEAVRKIIANGHKKEYYRSVSQNQQNNSNLSSLLSKETLTAQEISKAREFILQLPISKRSEMYEILQQKVSYRNQRNNASKPLRSDEQFWGKNLTDRIGIGFIMCQVTSLAMSLEYLGIANPDNSKQFEDFLESKGRNEQGGGWERYTAIDWMKLASSMGAKPQQVFGKNTKSWWESNISKHFSQGDAIIMSVGNDANAHVVRVQSMNDKGLMIDDPNGYMPPDLVNKFGFDVDNYRVNQFSDKGSEKKETYGENNIWTWEMLKNIPQRYVVILSRQP
ncbi:C39 family peptidase [Deinococcus sp. RIT780]|uniref:C39 family peptidase n=1 Tax=Deinococcus sp. RIT780 TaxID=2870472 RepID=UPI001C8940A7|nr:C39 family peptidase [Deinococcus sp. RIT780]MBX8466095.1 hypothetical protein [Deinococcus sp. RIT780]